jgi:hypothetical protein
MATLAKTNINVAGAFTPTKLSLGSSDTFTYTPGTNSILVLYNTTASPITVTIDGASGTTVPVPNTGATLDVSAGIAITVPANAYKAVRLDTISAYLNGTIAMTGGTGVDAVLLG